jgi:branched-chain amino acid transport system substrate-binding protein
VKRGTLWATLIALCGVTGVIVAGCSGGEEKAPVGPPAVETTGVSAESTAPPEADEQTFKIVSDLPLQGSTAAQAETLNNAIRLYLEQIGNKAGPYDIEFESFDDASAEKGAWDEQVCAENAREYVADEAILGVVGPLNSGCAKIMTPILNEASVALVSPANLAPGLTHVGPGSEPGEPEKYYPTGTRNYARVVVSDDYQGEAAAEYMKNDLSVTKVFILDDKDAYGKAVADAFEQEANDIGLEVAGHQGWDVNAQSYTALMTKIKATGADGIFIGGSADFNGDQVLKDKVAVVGDNEAVKLVVSDGFVLESIFAEAGPENVEGVFGSAPVLNPPDLTGAGADFVAAYTEAYGVPDVYTAYGAAAAQVLLDAIGRSDGTRQDVVAKLFETSIEDGIVGPMSFDENGDPESRLLSIFKGIDGTWAFEKAVQLGE